MERAALQLRADVARHHRCFVRNAGLQDLPASFAPSELWRHGPTQRTAASGVAASMPSRIEDYALIGDCETAALVARDGSIDWLCWPRFDSDACFAALLGTEQNGRWLLAPADEARVTRRYRPDTLILETRFE